MKSVFYILILFPILFLAGCSVEAAPTEVPSPAVLIPWSSPTPAPTLPPLEAVEIEIVAPPTPMPRTHIIEKGEDLGGLALRYGVPLADIMAANPDIDPRMISIGTSILIPTAGGEIAASVPAAAESGVSIQPPHCFPDAGGGLTCFALVRSSQDAPVENISLNFVMLDESGSETDSRLSYAPINLLPAGQAMPLMAAFQGPLPVSFTVRADLAGALPGGGSSGRYLDHRFENVHAEIAPDGFSAKVTGQVAVSTDQAAAATTWVLAVGYNAAGDVVSFRRWEDSAGIEPGQSRSFEFTIYSSIEKIARVEFLSESRPE